MTAATQAQSLLQSNPANLTSASGLVWCAKHVSVKGKDRLSGDVQPLSSPLPPAMASDMKCPGEQNVLCAEVGTPEYPVIAMPDALNTLPAPHLQGCLKNGGHPRFNMRSDQIRDGAATL